MGLTSEADPLWLAADYREKSSGSFTGKVCVVIEREQTLVFGGVFFLKMYLVNVYQGHSFNSSIFVN